MRSPAIRTSWRLRYISPCRPPIASNFTGSVYERYYGPDYKLHYQPSSMENLNIPENLEKIKCSPPAHPTTPLAADGTRRFVASILTFGISFCPLGCGRFVEAYSSVPRAKVFEHLKQLQPAPNVQMHQTPAAAGDDDDDGDDDPERRVNQRTGDAREHGAEFYAAHS